MVGGLPAAAVGAAVFVVLALLAVRYVHGAEAMDSDFRRKVRLVGGREPTLRYWDAVDFEIYPQSVIGYDGTCAPAAAAPLRGTSGRAHGVSLGTTQPRKAAAIVGAELGPGSTRPGLSSPVNRAARFTVRDHRLGWALAPAGPPAGWTADRPRDHQRTHPDRPDRTPGTDVTIRQMTTLTRTSHRGAP